MMELKKERNILHQLVKSREAVRKKYNLLKQNKAYVDKTIGETLKPIIDPLDKLVSLSKTKNTTTLNKTDDKKYFNSTRNNIHEINHNKNTDLDATFDDDGMRYESVFSDDDKASDTIIANKTLSSQYLETLDKKTAHLDKLYGVRKTDGKLYFGDSEIFLTDDDIVVKSRKFPNTNGLLELLFKKDPNQSIFDKKDLNTYREMMKITNCHRKKFEENGEIRRHKSRKYDNIIAPLFENVSGQGLQTDYKVARFNSIKDYVYWDNPNELVDRLRLLVAERSTGNNAHANEIYSIIEDLRDGGYIY